MGSCRCINGGGSISTTTLPAVNGPWTIGCWFQANPNEYVGAAENIAFAIGNTGGSSQGISYVVGPIGAVAGSSNSTVTALQFTGGGGTIVGRIMLIARNTRWNYFSVAHPATGSTSYYYRYGAEDASGFTSFAQTVSAQLTFASGGIFLGTSQFTENTLDTSIRSFFAVNRFVDDGELFQISRNLDVMPAGAIHWLPLSHPVGRNVNQGSSGNWTIAAGAMTLDTSEPVFQEPITMAMNF